MKNKLFSYVLIWTIFLATTGMNGVFAQSLPKEAKKDTDSQKVGSIFSDKIKNNWKSWNPSTTNALDTPFDLEKIKKDIDRETVKPLPKQKMSRKSKALWVAIILGSAVGLFFLIKYADPLECEIEAYCSAGETCGCLKYKDKEKK